jgi:hypothetical protein
MKTIILLLMASAFFSCTHPEKKNPSERNTYGNTGEESNIHHTGNAAVEDRRDSSALASHETGFNPDMDSTEANGTRGGTPSGRGTTKHDIARHNIGNSTPGFKTTSIDTAKRK